MLVFPKSRHCLMPRTAYVTFTAYWYMLPQVRLHESYQRNKRTRVQHCSARIPPTVYSYKLRED
jgi:hypothetical protein